MTRDKYWFIVVEILLREDVQYFKEIIEDLFIPLRKMRDDIRQKFMIDYRKVLLDLNPGSTCTLDVVESDNGSISFKRMYICFKEVKDGWLAGCRKDLIDAANDWLPDAEQEKMDKEKREE
nr:calcium/proton exchanger [Tanacetum cinerariifolium]